MNPTKAIAATMLLTCALLLTACAQNRVNTATADNAPPEEAASPAEAEAMPEEAASPAEAEATPEEAAAPAKATRSEGADTACSVSYAPYAGAHEELFLTEGDRIAVIAPSAIPSKEQVDATIKGLESWGYVPVAGSHVYDEQTTLENCLEDLTWALEDPSIKAVFCVRGGYGASEVQDALALERIASAHKLIIGDSDITVYHSAWTKAKLPSIHSSMSASFTDLPPECVEAEQKLLQGEIPSYTCENSGPYQEGEAEGILIGGNLSTFLSVLGTAYDCTQTDEPYILFLEDVGENMSHIHRYLTVLKHLGVLDRAAGIVFGEWTDMPLTDADYDGRSRGGEFASVADMIEQQILPGIDAPVAFGFPAGHGDANYPLLMGTTAHLSVTADSFTLSWT